MHLLRRESRIGSRSYEMGRETRACRYCASANVVKSTHCRRCRRWLGPHDTANEVTFPASRRFTRYQRNVAVMAIAAAIAVGLPYLYSTLDVGSTTELAAPHSSPPALRPLPDPARRFDTASRNETEPANPKPHKDRKQNTQIASRKH